MIIYTLLKQLHFSSSFQMNSKRRFKPGKQTAHVSSNIQATPLKCTDRAGNI